MWAPFAVKHSFTLFLQELQGEQSLAQLLGGAFTCSWPFVVDRNRTAFLRPARSGQRPHGNLRYSDFIEAVQDKQVAGGLDFPRSGTAQVV